MPRQYNKEMKALLSALAEEGERPTLLLHACCAPCASYPLTFLADAFELTVYYYNPNITDLEEQDKRYEELRRHLAYNYPRVSLVRGGRDEEKFLAMAKGLESAPEGGLRCARCFELRLEETARLAARDGYDYFATTLTLSPLKNPVLINGIGEKMAEKYGVKYLASDFKKDGGYLRSVEICKEQGLYRQNYCGCAYSKRLAGGEG
ncbi:MAG: epoxyqueuosine reductase QueH [Clostridia bacterium]|nr:epoxyqueuosine reductase QueH [Clostridia bacterium]